MLWKHFIQSDFDGFFLEPHLENQKSSFQTDSKHRIFLSFSVQLMCQKTNYLQTFFGWDIGPSWQTPQVQPGTFGVCLQLDCGHQHQGLQAGPGHLRETLRLPVKKPLLEHRVNTVRGKKKFHILSYYCPLNVLKLSRTNACRNVVFRGGCCNWQWVQDSTLDCGDKFSTAFSPSFCPSALEGWHVVTCWPCPLFERSLTSPKELVLAILSSHRHWEAGSHLHLHSPSELTECFPEGELKFAVWSEGIQGS